jgi:uncharacterized protein
MQLDQIQLRVLGALIEKEITTPENYPLTLNALQNACNQRSSRDPVLDLEEDQIRQALHTLEDLGLTAPNHNSRVPKYEHRIRTVLNLRRDETALLCLLLLRGPQTPGELRSRADRMYTFDDLASVVAALDRLATHPPASESDPNPTRPLVTILPRQPGSREARYAHLLGDPIALSTLAAAPASPQPATSTVIQRIAELEAEVASLQSLVRTLATRLEILESNVISGEDPSSKV